MTKERGKPISIGDILSKVMEDRGLGMGGVLAALQKVWPSAVGEGIAAHAWPEMLKAGRLTVTVDNNAWMNQLSMLSPGIIDKINGSLKQEAVLTLHFRLGKINIKKAVDAAPRPQFRELTDEETAAIDKAVRPIGDETLREGGRKLLSKACRRKRIGT